MNASPRRPIGSMARRWARTTRRRRSSSRNTSSPIRGENRRHDLDGGVSMIFRIAAFLFLITAICKVLSDPFGFIWFMLTDLWWLSLILAALFWLWVIDLRDK